jgi:hypothetical protein
MYIILFFAHKNTDYKETTHLFFELFESGEEQKDGQTSSEGFEWLAGSTEKVVSCPGRKWSAEG